MKYNLIILLAVAFAFCGCEDYFDDVNTDPNNPLTVTPNVLLPTVQVRMAYTYWGDASRYLGLNTQTVNGVGRQFVVYNNYGLAPGNVDALWSNMYTGVLNDIQQLKKLESTTNYYLAAADVMEAYAMLCLTDWWGDVPYTESFQPLVVLQPKFDSQESILAAIYANLNSARALFAEPEDSGISLGSGDVIYDGDAAKWVEFANAIEARARLHEANRNGDYAAVLAAIDAGTYTSPADDADVTFGTSPTGTAPWYQYIEQRDDCEVGAAYTSLLFNMNDPRLNTLGRPQDVPGHPIYVRDRSTPLSTFVEMKFVEAEAALETNDAARAHAAYIAAVSASLDESLSLYSGQFIMGTDTTDASEVNVAQISDDYLASVDPGVGNLTLEDIITQKYIAMSTDPEVFSDWRRTGFPALTPNTGDVIPRRLPYPLTETLSNKNTPSQADVTLFSRVWWDN